MWSLFKSRLGSAKDAVKEDARIDRLTYAIGDIHGCNDLFLKLLDIIRVDATRYNEVPRIVLLGDYVDRGNASNEVLETILSLRHQSWCDVEVLLGNHELTFRQFLLDSSYGPGWMAFGAAATLAAYGISIPSDLTTAEKWRELRREAARKVPASHVRLLYEAKLSFTAGNYFFVHGGVRPGVPLNDQGADTFLWIRDEFLAAPKSCDFVVVHGHSAREDATNQTWRIGVDTGAYATGILTAVRLRETTREIIQATR